MTPSTRRLLDTGFKSVKYGIFYKRGAELSDSQAATRLMIYVGLGSMLLGVLLTVGLAGDAVWAARTATSSFKRSRHGRVAPRDPEVAPPFFAVLIGRHHRVISELRSRPPSPRGASDLSCTSKLNLPQG